MTVMISDITDAIPGERVLPILGLTDILMRVSNDLSAYKHYILLKVNLH